MDPSGERHGFLVSQHQARNIDMKQYQGYSVSTMPLDRPDVPPGFAPAASPAPIPVEEDDELEDEFDDDDFDDDESEIESVDFELEKILLKPPPAPVPSQLARFHHQLEVGVFVATIEMLTDRGDGKSIEEIRAFALQKEEELIASTGEVREPEIPGKPMCGMARIKRDLKRMSKHTDYFNDLCNKFVEEFDKTHLRVVKLRQATGFIKGLLARDGQNVFNIPKPRITEFSDMLDIFKINADFFIEWLKSHQEA